MKTTRDMTETELMMSEKIEQLERENAELRKLVEQMRHLYDQMDAYLYSDGCGCCATHSLDKRKEWQQLGAALEAAERTQP